MADTFIGNSLHFSGEGLSSPSKAPVHHRDIRYSISAIRCYAFVVVSFSLTVCEFSYHKNPNLQLIGYVVSVLQNTIVVDVTEIMGIEVDDVRQVVKHSYYNKVDQRQIKNNVL